MDDDASSDLQKCLADGPMDTDEGPLINENSNGLSHLLTESEFNSVDAAAVDESSVSNQGFMNAVELSAGSVGDYLENNTDGFNVDSFDVGDNAVNFPGDSMNNVLSDGDSRLSDAAFKATSDTEGYTTESQMKNDFEMSETSNEASAMPAEDSCHAKTDDEMTMAKADDDSNVAKGDDSNAATIDDNSTPEKIDDDSIPAKLDDDITIVKLDEESIPDLIEDGPEKMDVSGAGGDVKINESSEIVEELEVPQNGGGENISAPIESKEEKWAKDLKELKELEEPIKSQELIDSEVSKDSEVLKDSEVVPKDAEVVPKDAEVVPKDSVEPKELEESKELKQTIKLKDLKSLKEPEIAKETVTKESETEKKSSEVGGAEETEVVSEDELPLVQKPSVKDAENVSDDELPGPKPADLPADTEVVSEDELPSSKKEVSKESRKRKADEERDGYDPGSPTSESESSNKKQAVAKNGESKPISGEKRSSTDEKPKKKALPELDKYWKVVNDDPTDFTGWTYLLQYVDQESDVEAAREAYDAFLSHYPYCYGYWRKYADYEKRKGSKKKCLEVLERGLKAIPLSVDLWIHYLNHIKTTRPEDHLYIRAQFERAIDACGLEFRSDRLWEAYIKWEAENGSALNVTHIYDRLLATPTLGYTAHFDNFQEHVMSEPVAGVVDRAELVKLRAEVRDATGQQPQLDLPPGEDEPGDHIASEEEAQAIKERIIAARRKIHKSTGEEVAARWTFEEGIKRPYFHVKPLERCQLKNWKMYLEWEKTHGSLKRALVLHERCLIACALYDEFWMRIFMVPDRPAVEEERAMRSLEKSLVKFLEERSETNPELLPIEREVLERACTVHHLDKPELHLHWAHFEEANGNSAKAAEILDRIEKTCPNIVQIQYRRVNLERRRGELDKCSQLYEGYISTAKSKAVASALAVKYARFQFHVRHAPEAARKVLDDAIAKDPLNPRLHMQRLDLALHTPGTKYEELEELVSSYEKQDGAELETSASLAWRRRELAEELGGAAAARAAQTHARALAKHLRKRARKERNEPPPLPNSSTTESKKKETSAAPPSASTTSSAYYQPPAAAPYEQSYAQPYQPPWGYQQPPGPYQHHPGPWPQYPNYY